MVKRQRSRRRSGFTLMEVLLVMAILIILASLVTVGYQQIRRNTQADGAKAQIKQLEQACNLYLGDVGQLPTSLQDLRQPPQGAGADKWRGPYLDQEVPKDPWSNNYVLEQSTDNFNNPRVLIYSMGPDLQQGTADDISNMQTNSSGS